MHAPPYSFLEDEATYEKVAIWQREADRASFVRTAQNSLKIKVIFGEHISLLSLEEYVLEKEREWALSIDGTTRTREGVVFEKNTMRIKYATNKPQKLDHLLAGETAIDYCPTLNRINQKAALLILTKPTKNTVQFIVVHQKN